MAVYCANPVPGIFLASFQIMSSLIDEKAVNQIVLALSSTNYLALVSCLWKSSIPPPT